MISISRAAPKIAIVGAGPGGLVLARILHLRGIKVAIFERETSLSLRPQGGTLDMHPETGQHALKSAGLWDSFQQYARYEDQGFRLYDSDGNLALAVENIGEVDRPEIDRSHLRQILLDSLPADAVQWGKDLASVPRIDNETVTLQFKDGSSHQCELVIGADGAWSRVRALVSSVTPVYSGITFYELGIDDVDRRFPELSALVGRGLMFALGDCKAIIAQRNSNAHIKVYAALPTGGDRCQAENLIGSAEDMKIAVAAQFPGWDKRLLQIIFSAADQQIAPRPIYELPIGHQWQNLPGVTLLGDAAHVMSPFAGKGANLAMRDATDIADAIDNAQDWRAAIRSYEGSMFPRAAEAASGAAEGLRGTFAKNALAITAVDMQHHLRKT